MKLSRIIIGIVVLIIIVSAFAILSPKRNEKGNINPEKKEKSFRVVWDYVQGSAVALCDNNQTLVLIDEKGNVLHTIIDNSNRGFDSYFQLLYGNATRSECLISYNGKSFVVIDRDGNEISPQFDYIRISDEGDVLFVRSETGWYFIDKFGNDLSAGKRWESISGFFDLSINGTVFANCCVVEEQEFYGITNGNGEYLIMPKYINIEVDIIGNMYGVLGNGDKEVIKEFVHY